MIDRATFHVRDGIAVTGVGKIYDPAKRKTRTMAGAVIRLSEYEDTGLDPWEIRRLKEQDELDRKTLLNFDCLGVEDLATRYCLARSERDSLKAERDAAVRDLQLIADRGVLCVACKNRDPAQEDPLSGCPIDGTCTYNGKKWSPNFVWRGPQQEET